MEGSNDYRPRARARARELLDGATPSRADTTTSTPNP